MRYELSDYEWNIIKPMLPNKPRGIPRVDDRRVLNGIFWVLRSGALWRDVPEGCGPQITCYNRFVRWRQAGVWDQIMDMSQRPRYQTYPSALSDGHRRFEIRPQCAVVSANPAPARRS